MTVFVSMRFKGRNVATIRDILGSIQKLTDADEVLCNYWYGAPETGVKKLHELGHAISLMARSDEFVYVNDGDEIPEGCRFEIELWNIYGEFGKFYTYWPEKNSLTND